MNKFTKIAALMAAIIMIFPSSASAENINNDEMPMVVSTASFYEYDYETLSTGSVGIIKYNGNAENVVIPQKIAGRRVSYIENSAFKSCTYMKSVVIPDTVTSIGKWAFAGCESLESVKLPSMLSSIEAYAFMNCRSLSEVNFSGELRSVGSCAFFCCESLSLAVFSDSTVSLGDNVFAGCSNITVICPKGSQTEIYAGENGLRYFTNDDTRKTGDADEDGEITSADALIVLRYSTGVQAISRKAARVCDIDSDGEITSADAMNILRMAVE
ncbi:MAG: leucine-rich repeat protein [Clostridia bacterium]|nr:leucine-rich repeat protein [Clostridia bacterium]